MKAHFTIYVLFLLIVSSLYSCKSAKLSDAEEKQRIGEYYEAAAIYRKGYEFKIVKGIVTNFHQPKSTLLLLISAFVKGNWKSIYEYALEHDFRFLSYGDSSLLL